MKKIFVFTMLLISTRSFTQTQGTVPIFNSDLTSNPVILIDFDGHYVTGTPWNWNGPINAAPSGLSNAVMKEIIASVAADYRIFQVNITTDPSEYNAAPAASRMRVIVTTTSDWYGSAGGVAYVGSYSWGDDTPCWVFSALLSYDAKKIAEAISHEAGHTLGLQHQSKYDSLCNKLGEYNTGSGNFTSGWSPIMGVSYYTNVSTWMKGSNTISCGTVQDDIATIAGYPNNLTIRTDDVGNTLSTAKTLTLGAAISADGVISTISDKDVFAVTTTTLTRLNLTVSPESVDGVEKSANLNIKLSLLNKNGAVIKAYTPASLGASIDTTLKAARYFLLVEGVGSSYIPDYGSVGKYIIRGSAVATSSLATSVSLTGTVTGTMHNLQWSVEPDITVTDVEVLQSADGKSFTPVQHFQAGTSEFSNHLAKPSTIYYQVKVTDDAEIEHYSKVISLSGIGSSELSVLANAADRSLRIQMPDAGDYEIFGSNGQLYQRGKLYMGTNLVYVRGNQKGIFVMKTVSKSGLIPIKFIFP